MKNSKQISCGKCNKNQAIIHPQFGVVWCDDCQSNHHVQKTIVKKEWVPERIKDDRKKHFNSIVQPYRSGELSKEYIDAHGTKGIKATDKEIRGAKNVWSDLSGWSTRERSI